MHLTLDKGSLIAVMLVIITLLADGLLLGSIFVASICYQSISHTGTFVINSAYVAAPCLPLYFYAVRTWAHSTYEVSFVTLMCWL